MQYYEKTLDIMEKASGTENSKHKEVSLELYCFDECFNSIGAKVSSEDGKPCDKKIEQFEFGNNIATAIDVLCGMSVPLGAKINIKIDIEL